MRGSLVPDAAAIARVVERVVARDYEAAAGLTPGSRVGAADLQRAIEAFGRPLVAPPAEALAQADIVRLTKQPPYRWSVWVSLWVEEDGRPERSNLTLQLRVADDGAGGAKVLIDDVQVIEE